MEVKSSGCQTAGAHSQTQASDLELPVPPWMGGMADGSSGACFTGSKMFSTPWKQGVVVVLFFKSGSAFIHLLLHLGIKLGLRFYCVPSLVLGQGPYGD